MAKKKELKNNNNSKVKVYKVNGAADKEEASQRRDSTIKKVLVVVIIVLAIAAIFSGIMTFFPTLFGRFTLGGELAAKVNGRVITMQQLDTEYDRLPVEYKYYIAKEAFLGQLIDEILLTQEATKQGIIASDAEISDNLASFMSSSNITSEKLEEILKAKKMSYAELKELINNQLVIDKLLNQSVKSKINVTTEQALQYYNQNAATFKVPEMVTARHILIGLANKTQQEAEAKANIVLKELKTDKSNFCELVKLYSDDSGSVDKCGEYSFTRGQMVAEFEKTAFEQGIGKESIVKTSYGSHILWTVNMTPEKIILFKDVEDQIILVLANQQEKMIYSDFLAKLRENAKITNYVEQKAKAEAEAAKKAAEKAAEAEQQPTQQAEAAGQIKVNISEPAKEQTGQATTTANVISEDEEISAEQKELENQTEPAITEVEEAVEQPAVFAECLTAKGAILYGAYWDSSTKKQKEYFGADFAKIKYVECGVQGDYQSQTQECDKAGIMAYPTWMINGEKYLGVQESSFLAALTGCKA